MCWFWFLVGQLGGKSELAPVGNTVNNAVGDNLRLLFGWTHLRQKCIRSRPSGYGWTVKWWADAVVRTMHPAHIWGGPRARRDAQRPRGLSMASPVGQMIAPELEQPSGVKVSCSMVRPLRKDSDCSNAPPDSLNPIITVKQAHRQACTIGFFRGFTVLPPTVTDGSGRAISHRTCLWRCASV